MWYMKNEYEGCEIWCSYGSEYKDYDVGCDIIYFSRSVLMS